MSTTKHILREYLISLGFNVDKTQVNRWDRALDGAERRVLGLGKTLVGMGATAKAAVYLFASQMDKLYQSSQRANSTVSNLQALQFASKQIGLDADAVGNSVLRLAQNLREQPGLQQLAEQLTGGSIEGRDLSDVALDLVKALQGVPYEVAVQMADMFGMDSDTYFMLSRNLDKFRELVAERKKLNEAAAVDADAAARAANEYKKGLDALLTRIGVLTDKMAIGLLPLFQQLNEWLIKIVDKLIEASGRLGEFIDKGKQEWRALKQIAGGDVWEGFKNLVGVGTPKAHTQATGGPVAPPVAASGAQALFAELERRYGLPAGFLDRQWAAESGRGKYMLSPAGARGHFGIMPSTAKEWGVAGQENDLQASAQFAAKYMRYLLDYFRQDIVKATAAYNWGMGNVERKGLGAAPAETRGYVPKVAGVPFEQNNTFHIHGGSEEVRRGVERGLDGSNATLTRNLQGAVQ